MCGIVAAARLNTKASKIGADVQEEIMRFWHTELMMLTEERGKDAAGSALLWEDGSLLGIKHGTAVSNLICDWDPDDRKKSYLAFMRVWRKYNQSPVSIAIGHCRKLSVGTAWKNENNHPHYVRKKIVLIHNGTLKNHHKLKTTFDFKCKGDADSEVIANLVYMANHEKPKKKDKGIFTLDQAEWVVDRLQGSFSCIALNADNPYQMLAFRDGRPFELALSKKAGLIFVASETKFFSSVLARYERARRYYGMDHWPDLELTKQAMPDDHAWVINLKDPVDKNTKIADLIDSKSMPKEGVRKKDFKVETTNNYASGYSSSFNNQKTGTSNTSTTKSDDKKDDKSETRTIDGKEREVSPTHKSGYIWHTEERIYVKQNFSDLKDGKVADVDRTRTDNDAEDTSATKTDVEDMSTTVKEEENKNKAVKKSVPAEEIVDEDKTPDNVEDAKEEYLRLYGYYKTQQEVGKDADIFINDDKETARVTVKSSNVTSNLDLKTIGDRIRAAVSGPAFTKGWEACEAVGSKTDRNTIDNLTKQVAKENEKKKSAESRLLNLKSFVLFLTAMIDSLTDDYGIDDKRIANAIALVDSMNHGVKEAAIEDIFTERESALVNLGQLLDEIALARGEETKVAVAEEND
jgi:glucosamine 6-phosphate synthetase-like amidotransferase/phosphosugar isomerase protein